MTSHFTNWHLANNRKHVKRLGKLSDALYARIFSHVSTLSGARFNNMAIHLADAVDCGTISPMDAYNALSFVDANRYWPTWISCRESNYDHLV